MLSKAAHFYSVVVLKLKVSLLSAKSKTMKGHLILNACINLLATSYFYFY